MKKNLQSIFSYKKIKSKKKNTKIIINEQGEILQENLEILKECKNYFQKIYKKQETCEKTQNELLQNIKKTITENQNTNLSREIQISEIKEAIFNMEKGKSPGIDGLPIEFYKHFFETIKYDLQTTYNKSLFEHYSKPETWNQVIIALIPKKGDTKYLKYWRPISLLCTDYKILTKILANRLKHILPEIISEEQNCSIPNRTIFNNLFLTRDIITYTKEKNNNFYLLQIDQEKAFDKIDRIFLYKTMEKMGFTPIFINFIKILYNKNISSITNNRFLSPPISIERGLR